MYRIFIIIIFTLISSLGFSEESPFYNACKKEDLLKDRPQTGLFRFNIPKIDTNRNVTTLGLLLKLKKKIDLRIEESNTLIENVLFCNALITPSKDCKELLNWVDIEVPKFVREARYHLAVAQSPYEISSWKMTANLDVNIDLTSWALYKEAPWESLNEEEERTALNVINNYQLAIHTSFLKKIDSKELKIEDWSNYANQTMLYLRNDHFLKYKSMLGTLHLLQFLSSPNPNRNEIIQAVLEMKKKLESEKSFVTTIYTKFPIDQNERINKSVLPLFNYTSLLEEILLEEENYCALASSIVFYQMNQEMRTALMIGLPLMVACFFVPPAAAFIAGAGASLFFMYLDQKEISNETMKNLGHIYGDEGSIALDKMSELKRSRDFGLILLPTSFFSFSYLSSRLPQLTKYSITCFLNSRVFSSTLFRQIRIATFTIKKFGSKKLL